jgi:hypothetical protein
VACAAARLCVSDEPVAGWELGLSVDDDPDRLEPGERVQFGSDADIGCFADAGAWRTLSAPFRTYTDGMPAPRGSQRLSYLCERVRDESHRADLVTFTAEPGGVVRLGRTRTGAVASILVTSGMSGAKA